MRVMLTTLLVLFTACKTRSESQSMSDGAKAYRHTLETPADFEALQAPSPDDPSKFFIKHLYDYSDGRDDMYFMDTKAYPYHDGFFQDVMKVYPADKYLDLASFPEPKKISVGSLHYMQNFEVANPPAPLAETFAGKKGVMAFSVYHNIVDASQECVSRAYEDQEVEEIIKFQEKLKATVPFVENRVALLVCPQEFFKNKLKLNQKGVVVYSFKILEQQ
jgi:hypothetical protein